MWVAYDKEDDSLYVTGTTSYIGEATDIPTDTKSNENCNHDMCAVTMRLSASDGSTEWVRTTKGSPRWNFFDQTGDIELANELDGPYIYVALDDVGEEGIVTLDEGTPYSACRDDENASLTPEYEINPSRLVTEGDCPAGSTFVPRSDKENAFPTKDASTGANCGAGHDGVDACIIKYHKFTGLPVWGSDIHPVAGLATAPDGKSIMVAGFYWQSDKFGYNFDSVVLPDYNGIEGSYTAKLNAKTGQGEYAMHSGGVGKTRVYDVVADPNGDVYMVGYTQSSVINWGGTLQTKIIEEGIDQNDDAGTAFQMGKVSSSTSEYQFFAVKLAASETAPLSCVESCDLEGGNVANPVIKAGNCLIDNVCYEEGESAEIFGRPCLDCKPAESQTKWSLGDSVGYDVCFIDNVCYDEGDAYSYRASRSETFVSQCQVCDPTSYASGWSVLPNFNLDATLEPPNDCINITKSVTLSPVPVPSKSPANSPTLSPVPVPPKSSAGNIFDSADTALEEIDTSTDEDTKDTSMDASVTSDVNKRTLSMSTITCMSIGFVATVFHF